MATSLDSKLDEILAQLSSQKEDISNLKSELKQNTKAVSSEVKKIKSESDFSWKRQGNKIQFTFNSDLEDSLKQGIWAIQNGKTDYALELLSEALEKIKHRNKLIKVADSSEGGWETVKQYISNPLASDSEDEKKLQKADFRAQKKRKSQVKVNRDKKIKTNVTPAETAPNPFFSSCVFPAWSQGAYGFGPVNHSQSSIQQQGQGRSFRAYRGCCFACGSFSHWRKDCPFVKQQPTPDTAKKQ